MDVFFVFFTDVWGAASNILIAMKIAGAIFPPRLAHPDLQNAGNFRCEMCVFECLRARDWVENDIDDKSTFNETRAVSKGICTGTCAPPFPSYMKSVIHGIKNGDIFQLLIGRI
jgi:hypothetical protein